jgi:hypothetical protein
MIFAINSIRILNRGYMQNLRGRDNLLPWRPREMAGKEQNLWVSVILQRREACCACVEDRMNTIKTTGSGSA